MKKAEIERALKEDHLRRSSKGGRTTLNRYGAEYFRRISKLGVEARQTKKV